MNLGRISRNYRRHREVDRARDICLRCFQLGHRKGPHCRNDPLVTCGKCYRAYIFTTDCSCDHSRAEILTLRLVAGRRYPRPVIDVVIGTNIYEAFINMSIENTRISLDVLDHINECKELIQQTKVCLPGPVEFSIRRRQRQVVLQFDVKIKQTDPVILGMDFFMETGFDLTADRVSINERSPVLNCPKTVDYLYNRPQGSQLRDWLRNTNRAIHSKYMKGNPQPEEMAQLNQPNEIVANEPENNDGDVLDLHASFEDLNFD